jgi:hypothetical protein
MNSTRRPQPSSDRHRSDYGCFEYTERDDLGLLVLAEMKFVPFDLLGQYLDPDLSPAVDGAFDDGAGELKRRGGSRKDAAWPRDRKKRLNATAELVRRWEKKMGYAERWKPWSREPAWARVNQAGLRTLGLDWNEIPFPDDHKRLSINSHFYHVNKLRLHLARGGSNAPAHEWISERKIYVDQYRQGIDVERAHRPDGVMLLKADSSYPLLRGDIVIEDIPICKGQTAAIEVEMSRKKLERLGEGILPSLLTHYDFAWYFCTNREVYETVVQARRDYLPTNEERKRIRILLLEEGRA